MDRQKKVCFLMVLVTHNCSCCNQIYKKWNMSRIYMPLKNVETVKAWYIKLYHAAIILNTAEKCYNVKMRTQRLQWFLPILLDLMRNWANNTEAWTKPVLGFANKLGEHDPIYDKNHLLYRHFIWVLYITETIFLTLKLLP